ncbi:MAG: hypothetical protein V9G19_25430 [Tetrasphaera sp.]
MPASAPTIDIVVVGAQKGLSTALAHVLGEHPDVEMAAQEFHGFLDAPYAAGHWRAAYDLFRTTAPHHGFKCASYFADPALPERLRHHFDSAHIVVGLRHPVDRAVSAWHWYIKEGLLPPVPADIGLTRVLDGDAVGYTWRHATEVLDWGLYAEHLARWRAAFPAGAVHVVTDIQLAHDPDGAMRALRRDLGLASIAAPPLPRLNTGVYSMPRLRWLAQRGRLRWRADADGIWSPQRPTRPLPRLTDAAITGIDRFVLARVCPNDPPTLPPRLRARLTDYFRADIAQLAADIGQDLSAWTAPGPAHG